MTVHMYVIEPHLPNDARKISPVQASHPYSFHQPRAHSRPHAPISCGSSTRTLGGRLPSPAAVEQLNETVNFLEHNQKWQYQPQRPRSAQKSVGDIPQNRLSSLW